MDFIVLYFILTKFDFMNKTIQDITGAVFLNFLVMSIILSSGCGKKNSNPDGREDVRGKITLNGKVIENNANIRFVPVNNTDKLSGGGGQITNGKFHLTGQDGVKPGKYKVQISAYVNYDRKTETPATGKTGDFDFYPVMLIPPEFNTQTTLEYEVVAGKTNVYNYDIQTSFSPDTKPKGKASVVN
jgi:hypothetical protein